jgi:hypothetical protein
MAADPANELPAISLSGGFAHLHPREKHPELGRFERTLSHLTDLLDREAELISERHRDALLHGEANQCRD